MRTLIPQLTGTRCPTDYYGGSICYATSQFLCRYNAQTYVMAGSAVGTTACPAGTSEHGRFTCPANGPTSGWFQIYCVADN